MSTVRPEFLKDVSLQRLSFFAEEGRPSATPTVGIKDSGGSTVSAAADTNVTQDPVNTTLSAAAAIGAKQVTLTAVTGLTVGRTYLLTNKLSQWEWVRVLGWDTSSKVVDLDEALEHTYTGVSADTFVSTWWYYTLQTVDTNQLRESMQATATYIVDSLTHKQRTLLDVCLMVLDNPLTRAAVAEHHADLFAQEWAEQPGEDYGRQRTAAWNIVLRGIRQQGRRPCLIVSKEDLFGWALAELELLLQAGGVSVLRGPDPTEALESLREKRTVERDAALAALQWYDADENESKGEGEEAPLVLDFER